MRSPHRVRLIAIMTACIILVVAAFGILIYRGTISALIAHSHDVRGVDVSSYQGKIDWPVLADQDIQFAFIKATEGSALVDPRFAENWESASQTDLSIGAYHFFSFDSPATTQAANFIATVPATPGMLPPAVDVEFYGDYAKTPPDPDEVRAQLDIMVSLLEDHYGVKPIIYATQRSYSLFISGYEGEYPIWIRDVHLWPRRMVTPVWTFWQYSDTGHLEGFSGQETHIDMNVYAGTLDDLRSGSVPAR